MSRYFLVGGAGFLGSHFADRLLRMNDVAAVTVYDNMSSGREWHFAHHLGDPRFVVVVADVADENRLAETMAGHDIVIHLASNPDIARAVVEPSVDFYQGTMLTHHVLEAMRRTGTPRLLYASGSGVYGDLGETEAEEDHGPLLPVSTYGASKLAGEALIASYTAMFGLVGRVYRFANVVGARQTHGVGFDFVRKLRADPTRLQILGDGSQSKSYIHAADVVDAVLLADATHHEPYGVFNVGTGDYITVKEIADLVVECMKLDSTKVVYEFTGGDRGWRGDVPVVRFSSDRIKSLGWSCRRTSGEALRAAILAMLDESGQGRI